MIRALIFAALAACSFDFEEIQERAPMDSQDRPDGVIGQFPAAIAAVPSNRDGVRFVVAGAEPFSLSSFSYDLAGSLDQSGANIGSEVGGTPVLRAPIGPPIMGAGDLVLVGGPETNIVELWLTGPELERPEELTSVVPNFCELGATPEFGREVAAVATGPDRFDLIVASADHLAVWRDTTTAVQTCDAACRFSGELLSMTVTQGRDAGPELVLALREGNGVSLRSIAYRQIPSLSDGPDCLLQTIAGGLPPDFGRLAAIGQLDPPPPALEDPQDIVFLAPVPGELSVLRNITSDSFVLEPPIRIPSLAGAESLALSNIDAFNPIDEVLVGVPEDSDGNDDGVVVVVEIFPPGQGARFNIRKEFRDSAPEDGQRFGRQIAVGAFRAGDLTDVPIIGAATEVFSVFQLDFNGRDPREQ